MIDLATVAAATRELGLPWDRVNQTESSVAAGGTGMTKVTPGNPFSDWIVPDGPPIYTTGGPLIACESVGPGGSFVCSEEIYAKLFPTALNSGQVIGRHSSL